MNVEEHIEAAGRFLFNAGKSGDSGQVEMDTRRAEAHIRLAELLIKQPIKLQAPAGTQWAQTPGEMTLTDPPRERVKVAPTGWYANDEQVASVLRRDSTLSADQATEVVQVLNEHSFYVVHFQ